MSGICISISSSWVSSKDSGDSSIMSSSMVGISSVSEKLSAKTIASFASKLSSKALVSPSTRKSSSEFKFSPKKVGSESEKSAGTSISISSGNLSKPSTSSIIFSSIIPKASSVKRSSVFSSKRLSSGNEKSSISVASSSEARL